MATQLLATIFRLRALGLCVVIEYNNKHHNNASQRGRKTTTNNSVNKCGKSCASITPLLAYLPAHQNASWCWLLLLSHCIISLKVVSPLFWQKLLEASQTTFKTGQFPRQFSLLNFLLQKMEEARMLMLSSSSAAISVQLRPCEWTCTSDGRSTTAGQGRRARDFSLN